MPLRSGQKALRDERAMRRSWTYAQRVLRQEVVAMWWTLMATTPSWLAVSINTVVGFGGLALLLVLALHEDQEVQHD